MINFKCIVLLVISLPLLSCTSFSWNTLFISRQKTPDEVIKVYLSAMQEQDDKKILSLIAPNHNATTEINDKIIQYGGVELKNVQLRYIPTENPYYVTANLRAEVPNEHGGTKNITDELYLQREGNAWFLVLGSTTDNPIK